MISLDIIANLFFESSLVIDSELNSLRDVFNWIDERNKKTNVRLNLIGLDQTQDWFYDEKKGTIHNLNNSFFSISGLTYETNGKIVQQPIILQPEIGYLGIACKIHNGVLYFLLQAKIEPGNVNAVQISPTIQATKSNFTRRHGGSLPPYFEFFASAHPDSVLVDQVQSEQSSRFFNKRNRNIIVLADDNLMELPTHKWITLGQLRELFKIPNLVNMDTRTVLSCFPLTFSEYRCNLFATSDFDYSAAKSIFSYFSACKMYKNNNVRLCNLFDLNDWVFDNEYIFCRSPFSFDVIFCDIAIDGREVKHWCQPLFRAKGIATFVLFFRTANNGIELLVSSRKEAGNMDAVELGPSIQVEFEPSQKPSPFELELINLLHNRGRVVYDNLLSEEGGRFYHEQNRNVIAELKYDAISDLPDGYFWCSYSTLNHLVQVNNLLNIQLRNLMAIVPLFLYEKD